jgi:hypothetical protein
MHYDIGGQRGRLAPHMSEQGPMPGVAYGKSRKEDIGITGDEMRRRRGEMDRERRQSVDVSGSSVS